MRRALFFVALFTLVFSLAGCEWLEFEETPDETIDTGAYTEQEMIELIESLMPEAYQRVDYDLASFEAALIDMAERNREATIGIRAEGAFGLGGGSGSGVVYQRDSGTFYAVTNHHVIDGASAIGVTYERNGLLFDVPAEDVELLGSDATTDLAVLRFEADDHFPTVEFADSYDLNVGGVAFAIGNPLGFDYFGTLTLGAISGLSRYVFGSDLEVPFIQHDAGLAPGNSGGGLYNLDGELIGINNMKIVDELAGDIGFAIPSNTVSRVIDDLEEQGYVERSFLGISAEPRRSDCGQSYGVCVGGLVPEGVADAAGIEVGDIIKGFKLAEEEEYRKVLNFSELREAILNAPVSAEASVRFERDGDMIDSDYVELVVHPDDRRD